MGRSACPLLEFGADIGLLGIFRIERLNGDVRHLKGGQYGIIFLRPGAMAKPPGDANPVIAQAGAGLG
jgi:hypothetical protein